MRRDLESPTNARARDWSALEKTAEERQRGLLEWARNAAEACRDQGMPVGDDLRIDMARFRGTAPDSDFRRDCAYVDRRAEGFLQKAADEKMPPEFRQHKTGNVFELLKTLLFQKHMGGRFVTVRASLLDDYQNGVDNLMVERESGEIICAFDEVVDVAEGERLKEKEKEIIKRNVEGGACLKYGITFHEGRPVKFYDGTMKRRYPLFYLALDRPALDNTLQDVEYSPGSTIVSRPEREALGRLLNFMGKQIKILKEHPDITPSFLQRLERFRAPMEDVAAQLGFLKTR